MPYADPNEIHMYYMYYEEQADPTRAWPVGRRVRDVLPRHPGPTAEVA